MGVLTSLNEQQREAVGILQIGTFLEYFDLMLYVHMAVVLNELFFPESDPQVKKLITSITFCTPFIFRPIGALIFGYIGDVVGRKATVIATTSLMALSCVVMANLPTYAQIGVAASWGITICRIMQGLSSMGEIIGAQLYLTEMIAPPKNYPIVALTACAVALGALMALALANAIFAVGLEWRVGFWCGAVIALVGFAARTALRESPEFSDAKKQLQKRLNQANVSADTTKNNCIFTEKVSRKTLLSFFLVYCGRPACFYFIYIYCGEILKYSFDFSPQQIIKQNLLASLAEFSGFAVTVWLCTKIHPLKIIKIRVTIFSIFILFSPFILNNVTTPFQILMIQWFCCIFWLDDIPATPIFFKNFPIFKRFTCASFMYALSRALIFFVTSVGMVFLTEKFNYYGLWIIFIPILCGFWWGYFHYQSIEEANGSYPHMMPAKTDVQLQTSC